MLSARGMKDLNEIRTVISRENIQLRQSYNATYRKKLEEVVFVKGDFLHKKISNKNIYKDYGAMPNIPEDAGRYFTFVPSLLLMIHLEETRLNANRNPNPISKWVTKVQ